MKAAPATGPFTGSQQPPVVVTAQPVTNPTGPPPSFASVTAQPVAVAQPANVGAQAVHVVAQPVPMGVQPAHVAAQPVSVAAQPVHVAAQPVPVAVMAQPQQLVAQPMQIGVPQGVNAGDLFDVRGPDGRVHRVQCPKPYPRGGVFTFTPTVAMAVGMSPVNIPPFQVTCPGGVGAGQQFEVAGPDGNRYRATCPAPFPRRGVFTFQPTVANKIDNTPLEAPFEVRVPPKGVGAGQTFFIRSPGGLGLKVTCPKPFPRGGKFMYTPVACDLENVNVGH